MTSDLDFAICRCGHSAANHEPDIEGYATENCQMLDCECKAFDFDKVIFILGRR